MHVELLERRRTADGVLWGKALASTLVPLGDEESLERFVFGEGVSLNITGVQPTDFKDWGLRLTIIDMEEALPRAYKPFDFTDLYEFPAD